MTTKSATKRVIASSPVYLVQVYDAAKAAGETSSSVIALLKSGKVIWSDKASVEPIHTAFMQGGMAGRLDLTRENACKVLALKGFVIDAKDPDKRRTFSQQAAYRATITAWSYCARAAGMPNKLTGGKRKPRPSAATPSVVGDKTSTAPVVLERVIIPRVANFEDVKQFARHVAAMLSRFENQNAKASFGEYRALIDAFVSGVNALGKSEAKVAAIKPGAPTKANEIVE
jgi:hypothetical protein